MKLVYILVMFVVCVYVVKQATREGVRVSRDGITAYQHHTNWTTCPEGSSNGHHAIYWSETQCYQHAIGENKAGLYGIKRIERRTKWDRVKSPIWIIFEPLYIFFFLPLFHWSFCLAYVPRFNQSLLKALSHSFIYHLIFQSLMVFYM